MGIGGVSMASYHKRTIVDGVNQGVLASVMAKVTNVTIGGGTIGWGSLWMFTIALAKLSAGQAVLALVIWPYYLGTVLAR